MYQVNTAPLVSNHPDLVIERGSLDFPKPKNEYDRFKSMDQPRESNPYG
jgi:hypothetical protein